MDWSDGYVSDISYTMRAYPELAPDRLALVAALQGVDAPDMQGPVTVCDLGCGAGLGAAITAATHPRARVLGVDFAPAMIASARALAAEAGLDNLEFREAAFRTVAEAPETLPEMDVVILHGVWSWVDASNRAAILAILRDRLKPGGLVAVSYNCLPGWSATAPLQRLMQEHARRNPGRSDRQVRAALDMADTLAASGFGFFEVNGPLADHLARARTRDDRYLAHEYLNAGGGPCYVTDVMADMAGAKLDFVGSATLLENFDGIALAPEAQAQIDADSDPGWRELLRSYAMNQAFRRDIYVKGARPLTPRTRHARLFEHPFAALRPPEAISVDFDTPRGQASGQPEIYAPIVRALRAGPITARDVDGVPPEAALQALVALTAGLQVHPALPPADPAPARRLNAALARRLREGAPVSQLAVPATGNALTLSEAEIAVIAAVAADPEIGLSALSVQIANAMAEVGQPRPDPAQIEPTLSALLGERRPTWVALGLVD